MRATLVLVLSLPLLAQSYDLKTEKAALEKITAAAKSGDDVTFTTECDRLLENHTITALAWYLCGKYLLFVKTDDEKKSLANAKTAYARLSRAIEDFSRTGKQTYYALDALQYQGLAAMLFHDHDRALVHFKAALLRDNRVPAAWYNVGVIYELKGLREEAMRAFDRYLRLRVGGENLDF